MQNVSKNMFKDSDDSASEIGSDDDRLEGWKPPTACGVDNSKALSSYEDIASGNVRDSQRGECLAAVYMVGFPQKRCVDVWYV